MTIRINGDLYREYTKQGMPYYEKIEEIDGLPQYADDDSGLHVLIFSIYFTIGLAGMCLLC